MINDPLYSENTNKFPHHVGETHLDVAKDKGLQNSPYSQSNDEDDDIPPYPPPLVTL